ncbi:MAG: AsmA family protein [Caldimonas sp.]|uniref:AsmA family protein n=1 Tax=Caldimonas sp. TaxID=2838790 RepID=UPI00391C70CE
MPPFSSPWPRRAAWLAAGLATLAMIAAAWLVLQFDAERYKGLAVDWVREHHQRELKLEGPVSLRLLPRLAVRIERASLSERQRPETFASVEQASLSVALWPLLRGALEVDRVELRNASVRLTRDSEGRRNIDDLLQPRPPLDNPAPAAPSAATGSLRLDVQGVLVENLRVHLDDRPAAVRGEVLWRRLRAGRLAHQVPTDIEFDLQARMDEPAAQVDVQGRARVQFDLDTTSLALREMALSVQGQALGWTDVTARLEGMLAYDGPQHAVQAEGLHLAWSATRGAMQWHDSSLSITRFGFEPERRSLVVDALALRLKARMDAQTLALDLDWPSLEVAGDAIKGGPLQGRMAASGPTTVQAEFRCAAPRGRFDRVELPDLLLRLKGRSGAHVLDGQAQALLTVQPQPLQVALLHLRGSARVETPGLQPQTLQFQGQAQGSAGPSPWQLEGRLGNNRFTTSGRLDLSTAVPTVQAQARFDRLDFNEVLAPSAAPAPQPASAPAGPRAVDLSVLQAVQGRLELQAGELAYRHYRLADVHLQAEVQDGTLVVPTLAGRLWGGRIDGSARAQAGSRRLALRGLARGIDVGAAVRDVAGKDLIAGRGDLQVDVSTQGPTVEALRSALAGQAALQVRDGAVKGFNLARALRGARAALTLNRDALQQARATEQTDFSEMSVSFQIAEGVARSDDLDMKSPFLRVAGEGLIDIGRNRIDYTVRAAVTSTAQGQGGPERDALRGLIVPVRLTGPLEAIEWNVRWSAVAAQAATSRLRSRLEDELKGRLGGRAAPADAAASEPAAPRSLEDVAKDQLKEKLKGLFK